MASIKTKIIKIGNSKGIRLPKSIIKQYNFKEEVILEIKEDSLVIRSAVYPRAGWDKKFEKMFKKGDDALLDSESLAESDWDKKEWKW